MQSPQPSVEFFDADGNRVVGILEQPDGSKQHPVTILCHGFPSSKNSSSITAIQERLNRAGRASLRFDFYGCGESDGDPSDMTVTKAVGDIEAAVSFVRDEGFEKVGLLGSSFGGFAALIAASKIRSLSYLLLKSPVTDYLALEYERLGKQGIRAWEISGYAMTEGIRLKSSFLHDIQSFDIPSVATAITLPTYIVHGSSDSEVPLAQSIALSKLLENVTLSVIEGADHQYEVPAHREEMIAKLTEWIISQ